MRRCLSIAGALLVTSLAFAGMSSPAQAVGFGCGRVWNDDHTVGIRCTGVDYWFQARARCKNGKFTPWGTKVYAGGTSYAYCSSVRSSLVTQPRIEWDITSSYH
jgi:hypothetical protein